MNIGKPQKPLAVFSNLLIVNRKVSILGRENPWEVGGWGGRPKGEQEALFLCSSLWGRKHSRVFFCLFCLFARPEKKEPLVKYRVTSPNRGAAHRSQATSIALENLS